VEENEIGIEMETNIRQDRRKKQRKERKKSETRQAWNSKSKL
jgi:hypothetical protein